MTKCSARISREFKRIKADSRHPVLTNDWTDLPVCGGLVGFSLTISQGCRCCHDHPELEVIITCSRCKSPYFPGIERFRYHALDQLEHLLNTTSQEKS